MRVLWNRCCGAVPIVCFSLLAGCATDPTPKSKVNDDALSRQAREARGSFGDEHGTGLCDKSRAIENDLGLR